MKTAQPKPTPDTAPVLPDDWRAQLKAHYVHYGQDLFACLDYAGKERDVVLKALTGQALTRTEAEQLEARVRHLGVHPAWPQTLEGKSMAEIRQTLPALHTLIQDILRSILLCRDELPALTPTQSLTLITAALDTPVSERTRVLNILRCATVAALDGRAGTARLCTDEELLALLARMHLILRPEHGEGTARRVQEYLKDNLMLKTRHW